MQKGDLVAGYVNQTSIKTAKKVRSLACGVNITNLSGHTNKWCLIAWLIRD